MSGSVHLAQRLLLSAALISASALGAETVQAASGDHIGDAVAITNTVTADYAQQLRKLAAGDDVRQDDTVEVKSDSQGELKLLDDTKLALGPGSSLVLDTFVYDSDQRTGSIILNLAKGAFRFITGVAQKPTYVINTPNAAITVRGTIFDVFILSDNSVWLLLHEGALEATGANNVCRVLDQPGKLMRISSSGIVDLPVSWSKLPGNAAVPFDTAFPFVGQAPKIDPTPVLTRAAIIDGADADPSAKPCVNPHVPTKIQKANFVPPTAPPQGPPQAPAYVPQYVAPPKVIQRVYVPKVYPPRYVKPHHSSDDWKKGARAAIGLGIILGTGIKFGSHHHPDYGSMGHYHRNY